MDHSEAIRLGAAEKYLLGELPSQQREEFEEHYFSCEECAIDVKSGAVLVDNARGVLREEVAMASVRKPALARRGWLAWFQPAYGLAAVLALVAILSYQNLVTIPALKSDAVHAQALTSFSLMTAASRGGETTVIHPQAGRPFGLYVDIPATQPFAHYTLSVRTGARNFTVQVSGEQARDTVQMLIPADAVQSGRAELIIEGHAANNGPVTQVARYPFEIQVQ